MTLRFVNKKLLRSGYTTGSCAAAAAKAAVLLLLRGEAPPSVRIGLPGGAALTLDVAEASCEGDQARCAVRKDSGDDPDATNGVLVAAAVSKDGAAIAIDGGEGVGRVTKAGLDQPVGAAAINSVPRRMIEQAVREACEECGYAGGLRVVISISGGEEIARRTFNPRMGIVGGLSVLGTTGIVQPMSTQALVDTVRAQLSMLRAAGEDGVLFTPGNYGEAFAKDALGLSMRDHISCGNHIRDAICAAAELGYQRILLVGHVGKLCKLGIGIGNTHSSHGDGRMETLAACALAAGADAALLRAIMDCAAADAAVALMDEAGLLEGALGALGARIEATLGRWVLDGMQVGYVCFSNQPRPRVLVRSGNAAELMKGFV